MNIEFNFLGNTIPTQLCLKVDDANVYYKRLSESFGYEFKIYFCNEETAIKIVEEIASVMEHQSYDHGQEWRRTKIESMVSDDDREVYEPCIVRAYFRIKDSY